MRFDLSELYIFVVLAHIYRNSSTNSASKLRLAKCQASCKMWSQQIDAKFVNLETQLHVTTIWQKFRVAYRWILITEEKLRVRTHHNALRITLISHITVGLAQARPNESNIVPYQIFALLCNGTLGRYFLYRFICNHQLKGFDQIHQIVKLDINKPESISSKLYN